MFSLESPHPKLSQICNYGICSKGPKNEFETAVVNEPSVFEPLQFYCTGEKDPLVRYLELLLVNLYSENL